MAGPVRVDGMAEFRRAVRATDRDALKEVQRVTKFAAEIVAVEARARAPRGTRPIPRERKPQQRLADSIKATTSGNSGIVRSALPYAKVHEYGGTISPKGTTIKIKRSAFVTSALDDKAEVVGKALEAGFKALARRHGW